MTAWRQATILNPSVWSPRVEDDLLRELYLQAGGDTRLDDRIRNADTRRSFDERFTLEELTRAGGFEADFAAACEEVRRQLADLPHIPHEVSIADSGVDIRVVDLGELADKERAAWQNPPSGGATAPKFASAPNMGSGLVPATLDTSLTAPTNTTTIVTGVAAGTKFEEIIVQAVGTTVAAVVNIFLDDGSTKHLYDQVLVTAVTSSNTAVGFRALRQYTNLIIPSASWSIKVTNTVAGNQSLLKVTATAGDLT